MEIDWYENRHKLESGMIFNSIDGIVQLDRTVPGDATQWYVLDWNDYTGNWSCQDSTIEPGDLIGEPLDEGAIKDDWTNSQTPK